VIGAGTGIRACDRAIVEQHLRHVEQDLHTWREARVVLVMGDLQAQTVESFVAPLLSTTMVAIGRASTASRATSALPSPASAVTAADMNLAMSAWSSIVPCTFQISNGER
jgi:hypothetical protein